MTTTSLTPTDSTTTAADAPEETTRRLVTVETIKAVRPIDGADAIEAASVRGWTVVVKKGEFAPGDKVIYIEVDAALPLSDPRFAFLEARGSKTQERPGGPVSVHVLKTARLRGVYSQGIVFSLAEFPEARNAFDVDGPAADLDKVLDVVKWEPPPPAGMRALGPFPSFLRKTDAERVQNLDSDTWATIVADADAWVPVEKLDGSSLTAWKTADGVLHVAGRNWELDPAHANAHWRAAADAQLAALLEPGHWVQAEVVGPGVQANPLRLPEVRLFVFGYGTFEPGAYPVRVPVGEWPAWVRVLAAPVVPGMVLPATIGEAVEQVAKMKSVVAPGRAAEGVVWTHRDGVGLPALNDRHVFKSISAAYLVKHGG